MYFMLLNYTLKIAKMVNFKPCNYFTTMKKEVPVACKKEKRQMLTSVGKDMEKLEPQYIVDGNVKQCNILSVPQKVKHGLSMKKVKVLVAQLCPTLCDPMNCSPPGFSVHGILQAKILEWVAIPFSRGSSLPILVTYIEGRFFTI